MMLFTANCSPLSEDSETAASGGNIKHFVGKKNHLIVIYSLLDHHHGRVQIKVYRGPSEDKHFAPWGYWVKQPHDNIHH